MIVLVVEPDASRAHLAIDRTVAAGHRAFPAATADDVRTGLRSLPRPEAVLASPRAPVAALEAAAEAGVPALLLDDGSGVPAAFVEAGLHATVSESLAPEDWSARIEAAVRRAARRLEADRAESALRQAGAAILVADAAGNVHRANAAYARVAGGAPRDPAGTNLREILAPDGSDDAIVGFTDATRGALAWTGDAMLVAGGARVPCRVTISPLRDAAERVTGVVAVLLELAEHWAREESLKEANRLLEQRAWIDPLTGLFHRGYLVEVLDRELARARRYAVTVAVLMIDLDDFSSVNTLLGHPGADEVLKIVAGALKAGLREGDVLARYGGDEFCAVLPSTDGAAAMQVAERVRERVRSVRYGPGDSRTLAASIGIAAVSDVDASAGGHRLLSLADRALYIAKAQGGDRAVDAATSEPMPPAQAPATSSPPTPVPLVEPDPAARAAGASGPPPGARRRRKKKRTPRRSRHGRAR